MTPSPTTVPPLRLPLSDDAASQAFGRELATRVVQVFTAPHEANFEGLTIHFSGDLGAGKTTVVRALLQALGVTGRIKSPTYTLVEPYVVEMPKSVESRQDVKLHCYHFDFYRFEDPHEWLEAGFRDYFSDAALRLVEWPERAWSGGDSLLPPPDLHVALASEGDGRVVALSARTTLGVTCLTPASFGAVSPSAVDASSRGA